MQSTRQTPLFKSSDPMCEFSLRWILVCWFSYTYTHTHCVHWVYLLTGEQEKALALIADSFYTSGLRVNVSVISMKIKQTPKSSTGTNHELVKSKEEREREREGQEEEEERRKKKRNSKFRLTCLSIFFFFFSFSLLSLFFLSLGSCHCLSLRHWHIFWLFYLKWNILLFFSFQFNKWHMRHFPLSWLSCLSQADASFLATYFLYQEEEEEEFTCKREVNEFASLYSLFTCAIN